MSRAVSLDRVRLLKIQATGDYREAYERLSSGGGETYYAQRYSVESDAALAAEIEELGVLCVRGTRADDRVLENGVRAMNAGLDVRSPPEALVPFMERFRPTHLALHPSAPHWIRWATQRGIPVLPLFASSFSPSFSGSSPVRRLLQRLRSARFCRALVSALDDPLVPCVASHNVGSCDGLRRLGVPPEKLVPWDWPPQVRPEEHAVKSLREPRDRLDLVFVGMLTESKGVGDCIEAVGRLHDDGVATRLQVIGRGDAGPFREQAAARGIGDDIVFEGTLPHADVLATMRAADVAIVPSRHDYAEGLPMTIYESLAVRTPLVYSDHPMFVTRLRDGEAALVYPERDAAGLAGCIRRLVDEPGLYRRLSEGSAAAWERLQIPVRPADLVRAWLSGAEALRPILDRFSLASGRYDGLLPASPATPG